MRALLLVALGAHLGACVLLVGSAFMVLLAGPSAAPTARRWEDRVIRGSRILVLVAIGTGVAWLLARTAVFENRPHAALEPGAVWQAAFQTWPGLVWLARHGLLLVLGVFLAMRADLTARRNWLAARAQALLLAALILALASASSHAAALTTGTGLAVAVDAVHLLGTGLWAGGLVPLAFLLRAASRDDGADSRPHAARAARRFSGAALVAMLVLLASGAWNAVAQVGSVAGLVGTPHGRLLLAKLTLLAVILGVATVNRTRILPGLGAPGAMRRLAAFVGLEAGLALALLVLAAAMTLTTPARHAEPVWPFPFRLSLDGVLEIPATRERVLLGAELVVIGAVTLAIAALARRGRRWLLGGAVLLAALGGGLGLPPLVVDAYPTTYRRSLVAYQAASIASGLSIYREQCATCHGPRGDALAAADLKSPRVSRRPAGEIFWLISHGVAGHGMPAYADRLGEAQRWDVINFIRALGAADGARELGSRVQPDRAWLAAPDFTVAIGPLAPGALRDHRGRRMVLLVLYTLPESAPRMRELARSYDMLSVVGVEVIAVPTRASAEAIPELGASPPVIFPVVTDGAAEIVATYRLFAPGPHAEILIDRQGYIRAIWGRAGAAAPAAAAVQAEVEALNAEKNPPPFPDDHVH
jgi:putative copper resistance protein D